MAPYFQVDVEKYAIILSGAKFCDLERNKLYFGTSNSKGPILKVAKTASKIWLESGSIKTFVKPKIIISTNFVK